MRIKTALVVLLIAVVSTSTVPVTGQEEPLPPVAPRSAPFAEFATVALAVEPVHAVRTPSLAEAARNNDFITFDTLYREAKLRGEPVAAFETLHELWTYSITDPIGAFYGADMYQRFARVYPGYSSYIDAQRIVDDRGNAYYPTSETRTFLLDRAVEGRAPRVLIATREEAPHVARATTRQETPAAGRSRATRASSATAPRASEAPASTRTAASSPAVSAPARQSAPANARIPAPAVVAASAPALATPAPVIATPAPVIATPAPVIATPVPAAPTDANASPAETTRTDAPLARENVVASRGILLLLMGLVGIGLLAVMLRTPRESQSMSIMPPAPPEKPAAPVEPLRRPDSSRKTGSHG